MVKFAELALGLLKDVLSGEVKLEAIGQSSKIVVVLECR